MYSYYNGIAPLLIRLEKSLHIGQFDLAYRTARMIYHTRHTHLPSAISGFISTLHYRKQSTKLYKFSIGALIHTGNETFPELFPLLTHKHPAVREGALEVLLALNANFLITYLIDIYCDGDFTSSKHVCRALLTACADAPDETLRLLEDILHHDNKRMRALAAQVLGDCGDQRALPALTRALDDESQWVRAVAQSSLQKLEA